MAGGFDLDAYIEAHRRYQGYRDAAMAATWDSRERLIGRLDLKLFPIENDTIGTWKFVWPQVAPHADGGFPWDEIYRQVRTTPRRFDVAIWSGPHLCGLAAGMSSQGNDNVTIRFLERWPSDDNPLRGMVALIVFDVADNYARILGKQRLKLKNPAQGAVRHYQKLEFSFVESIKGSKYMARQVES